MKNDYTKEALENTSGSLRTSMYNEEFLKSTLIILESQLSDLDTWSVYNNDKFNEEIGIIRQAIELIKTPKTFKEEYEEVRMK